MFSFCVVIHPILLHYIVKKLEEKIMKNLCILLINFLSNLIFGFYYLFIIIYNRDLLQIPEMSSDFTRHRLYFDSDYTSQETFTVNNFIVLLLLCILFDYRLLVVHILFVKISLCNNGILQV
jgi:hypothetical protein